jgi:hypothetical protein
MKERVIHILLEDKYLDETHNQGYGYNIDADLTKINTLNAYVHLRSMLWQLTIKASLLK